MNPPVKATKILLKSMVANFMLNLSNYFRDLGPSYEVSKFIFGIFGNMDSGFFA